MRFGFGFSRSCSGSGLRVQVARSGSGLGSGSEVGFGDQVRVQFGVGLSLGSGSARVQVFEQVRVSNTVTMAITDERGRGRLEDDNAGSAGTSGTDLIIQTYPCDPTVSVTIWCVERRLKPSSSRGFKLKHMKATRAPTNRAGRYGIRVGRTGTGWRVH